MAHLSLQTGTYAAADSLLGSRSERKIGHNTRLEVVRPLAPRVLGVRYHATVIVAMTSDGWIIVDTNGWDTVTTWQRVNALLPDRVSIWSNGKHGRYLYLGGYPILPYVDGLAVRPSDGAVGIVSDDTTYRVDVLMTADDVAAVQAAEEDRRAAYAAKRAARILAEHPTPRKVTYRPDLAHSRSYGATTSPMPNPHRMGSWRAANECPSCRAEQAEWRSIRGETLRVDHYATNGTHAWTVVVNGATISEPAGKCPHDCPDKPADQRPW